MVRKPVAFALAAVVAGFAILAVVKMGEPPASAPPIDQSEPLPAGKPTAHFRDARLKDAFLVWLKERGVPHRVYFEKGREYVVWEGPDNLAVEFMTGGSKGWK